MNHETQVRIMKELLRQLDEKVNVDAGVQYRNPTSSYTCPDLAKREWETFFQAHPQMIGMSADLPKPGSYLTVDDFGVPVLATRDGEGRFRAFVNACRHRGARVASEERGTSKHFMCPFHNWTYTNAGELVGISRERDFGKVDRSCNGLVELPAEERYGLLFVHPQVGGVLDVEKLLGELAPEFESWGVGDFTNMGVSVLEMDLNWKLATDTFGETYHFARLHKNTLAHIFHGDALSYEPYGRNHRFVFPSKGIDSMRKRPEDEWLLPRAATVLYWLFPNIQLVMGIDTRTLVRIYPDPEHTGRSKTLVSHYTSRAAIEAIENQQGSVIDETNVYSPEARDGTAIFSHKAGMEVFVSTVEHEDYAMGVMAQKAAESGRLEHLVFGRNEPALHHFHNTFRAELGMPPLEQIPA